MFRLANGALSETCRIDDFSLSDGDRLDLEALLQNIPAAASVEQCVEIRREGDSAVLKFDTTGQQNFAASTFQLELANVYVGHALADVNLHRLLYAAPISV